MTTQIKPPESAANPAYPEVPVAIPAHPEESATNPAHPAAAAPLSAHPELVEGWKGLPAADALAPPPPARERRRFTVAEYYRMAEVGILNPDERVELIEGVIVVMPPIGPLHAAGVDISTEVLAPLAPGRFILRIQNPLRLSETMELEPDVMLLRRRDDYYATAAPGPADALLVMEVSDSTLAYDRQVKIPIYARAGVPQTLIKNLPGDCIEGFAQPGPEGYARHIIYRRGDKIRLVSLPDLELAVADLLPPQSAVAELPEPAG